MAWLLGIPQLHRGLGEGAKEYGGRVVPHCPKCCFELQSSCRITVVPALSHLQPQIPGKRKFFVHKLLSYLGVIRAVMNLVW